MQIKLDSFSPSRYTKKEQDGKDLRQILTQKNLKLKIAESFTGGYLTSLFTARDGASQYLAESIICYSPKSKIERLSVSPRTISGYGTVSCACVRQMLKGLTDCDIAIATSGNASNSLETTSAKGTCFIGIAYKNAINIYKYNLSGSRVQIIHKGAELAVKSALKILQD